MPNQNAIQYLLAYGRPKSGGDCHVMSKVGLFGLATIYDSQANTRLHHLRYLLTHVGRFFEFFRLCHQT